MPFLLLNVGNVLGTVFKAVANNSKSATPAALVKLHCSRAQIDQLGVRAMPLVYKLSMATLVLGAL